VNVKAIGVVSCAAVVTVHVSEPAPTVIVVDTVLLNAPALVSFS
jgi:hypothetical protein